MEMSRIVHIVLVKVYAVFVKVNSFFDRHFYVLNAYKTVCNSTRSFGIQISGVDSFSGLGGGGSDHGAKIEHTYMTNFLCLRTNI